MKIGAQLFTVREFTQTFEGFADTIKKIAEIGYDCVQVSGISTEITAAQVAETCKAHGLEIAITHTNPERIKSETAQVVADHKLMGAQYIGIGSVPKPYGRDREGIRGFLADYVPVARAIKDAGLTLMYHNHAYEFEIVNGLTHMGFLFNEFTGAGFTLDTYWVQFGGADSAQWVRKLAGRVDVIHLKDYAFADGGPLMAEVYCGNLNWPAIFDAARQSGVKYAMVEQDNCYGRNPFDCLRTSLQNIKKHNPDLFK